MTAPVKQTVRLDALLTPLGQGAPRLTNWFRKLKNDPANATIAFLGDSTSDSAGPSPFMYARLGVSYAGASVPKFNHTAPGEGLAGMTADAAHIIDCGSSGQTLAGLLAQYDAGVTTAKSLLWLIAQAPTLISLSLGINDGRLGQTTKTQLTARLVRAVTILRRALPDTDIVLRIPNSLSTTNQGGANYVQAADGTINPAGAAQTYTDLMREAYYAVQDRWPNVIVADAQTAVFGTKAQPVASGGYMGDQLHPSQPGQYALIDWLVQTVIGYYPARVATPAAATAAKAAAPYAPWTADPAVLDDPTSFVLIGTYPFVAQGAGYLDFTLNPKGVITNYDIVRLPDGQAVQLPGTGVTIQQNSPTTRILWSSLPSSAVAAGSVRIYRQAVTGDSAVNQVLADPSWRYKRVGRITAGSTTGLTVTAASASSTRATQPASEWPTVMAAGDIVYVEGNGAAPVTLAGGQFAAAGANLALSGLSGTDYSTLVGRLVVIVGTHTDSVAGPQGLQGPAGGVGAVAVSGRWSMPAVYGPKTTAAATLGNDYAIPFVLLNAAQIDKLMVEVGTTVAGSAVRLGLRSSTNLLPDALLLDAGTFDTGLSGTKQSAALSAASLTPGNLYWLTCWATGSAAANLSTINGLSPLLATQGFAAEAVASYSCTRGATDAALPASWGTTYTLAGWAPLIRAHAV